MLRLRMCGAIPTLSHMSFWHAWLSTVYGFMVWYLGTGTTVPLPIPLPYSYLLLLLNRHYNSIIVLACSTIDFHLFLSFAHTLYL